MDLQAKIKECEEFTAKTVAENPEVSNIYYRFKDVPLADIKELAAKTKEETKLSDNKVYLMMWAKQCTVFFYSRPVRIQQPIVVEEEIEVTAVAPHIDSGVRPFNMPDFANEVLKGASR